MVEVEEETKNVYFIYAQHGEKSNIASVYIDDKVKKVKEIYKDNLGIQIQILYEIEIRKKKDDNRIIISLIDSNTVFYNSLIHFTKNEIFNEEDEEDAIIMFKLMFNPYQKKESNTLEQFTLPYDEQFYIFEKYFTKENNYNLLINLYASTISQYLLKDNSNFQFVINLFFKLYDETKMNSFPQLKKVLTYYFDNIKKILKNCEVSESIDIDKKKLNMLNETETIRTKLIKIINVNEENIDIFLSYYYIYFENKKFVQFINNKKYQDSLIITLKENRDIFNNFTLEVLTPELINEAEDVAQLVPLLQLYPNIVECFKLLTNREIFLKFILLKELYRKGINLMLIHKPKKNDNIDLLNNYFIKVYDLFLVEHSYPLIIKDNFFIEYYKTFQGDDDFHKNSIIIEMLKLYNTKMNPKLKTEEIINTHLTRGFSLIKKKKIKNLDFIEFIKDFFNDIKEKSKELIEAFKDGIEFEEKDYDFTNKFLTEDRFELKELLGYTTYYEVMEKIFSKFTLPKDLLVLKKWRLNENTPNELIKIFMLTIRRIWLKHPENNMYGLENLFATEFSLASIYLDSYEFNPIFNDLEDKIDKEKLMVIYSIILMKELPIKETFKKHIIKYIESYDKFTPRYVWYLMSTQYGLKSKIDFLKTYIDCDTVGENFTVKYYDFVSCPRKIDDRIILFINLHKYDFIHDYFEDSLYYKNSIKAKYDLEKNTFKDALIMRTNMDDIQKLLEDFFMKKTENNFFMVLINFTEKVDVAQKYYDSLKYVENYWKTFFPNEKANELINLNETINKFEKMKLEECMEESAKDNTYINVLDEAKEGRQLQGSIIFMEIYNKLDNLKNNDVERYHVSLSKFGTLAKLGEICDLNILDNDLKDTIINAVYKNIDLLNEELRFIKNYFKYDENKENNKFDIKIIRNNIIELVKEKQKNLGDYQIDLDQKFKEDEQMNKNEGNKPLNVDQIDIAGQLSHEEMLKKKKEIRNIYESIIYNSKIVDDTNANIKQEKKEFNNFYELVFEFYQNIFKIGIGLANLSLKEIYEEIILLSNKIFYLAKNLRIFDDVKNNGDKYGRILIFEFNFMIKMLERYQFIKKKSYINTLLAFRELYKNFQDNNFICQSINQLLDVVKEKITKFSSNYIFEEIFLYERIKTKENRELLKFILDSKYSYLYGDLLPVMDIIFDKEIKDKLRFDRRIEINDLEFNSGEFEHINEICINNKDNFGEMLLFYFENKIMNEIDDIIKKDERNIFKDDNFVEGLKKYLDFLQDNINNNNKILLLLYSIAFVKCFLYKLINIMQKNENPLNDIRYFFHSILKINDDNAVRTSIKMYIYKLIFNSCGNFLNFAGINLKQTYFINEDIEKYIEPKINKLYGFDFQFIPLRLNTQEEMYNSILTKFFRVKQLMEITSDNEIYEIISSNVDILYCLLANFLFSNYSDKDYFGLDDYKNTQKRFLEKINEEQIECLKNKETLKNLFLFLINFSHTKIYKEFDIFTYDQLLDYLISARFVIRTIYSEDENNLFYNLLLNADNTIKNNQVFFKEYYLKDFDVYITDKRKISCMTYKIINFVILSHIYFGYKLKLIKSDGIESILELNKLKNKDEKNISDYLLEKIFNEFDFIKKTLLPLLGINNVIIFMNLLYKELYEKIIDIKNNISEENIKKYEKLIDTTINKAITNYKEEFINYYKYENNTSSSESDENDINGNDTNDNNNTNDLIDIILEKDTFYNDKKLIKKKYPLLPYFTNTNYCVLNDDFKNQYLYYYNDSSNYPFISGFLTKANIFDIIDYLPKLNEFSNKIYNKLNMRYTIEEINSKTIKDIYKNELNGDINAFNDFLEKNKDLFGEIKIINNNQKIFEIINIDGSIINSVYKVIIKMYNEFLSRMKIWKIGKNKELIDKVIIQEARENDYNFNYILNDEKKVTIQEKLNELILLYSKRERKGNGNINVYDGGKINYNFEIIENKLEELFIFGKKLFLENQKVFIFAEEIFKPVDNIIKAFEKKYSPEINKDNIKKIEEYLKDKLDNENLNLFYEIYFVLKYSIQENFNIKIREEDKDNSFNNIIKYLELKSYSLPELKKAKDSLKENLLLNHLLFFYETLEIKVFASFTTVFRKRINDDDVLIKDKNISDNIKTILDTNNVIKLEIIEKAMKKYLLRNIQYENEYLFNLDNLIKKNNVWDINIIRTKDFKTESQKLNNLDKNNNVVRYIYCYIFNIEENDEPDHHYDPLNPEEDEDL